MEESKKIKKTSKKEIKTQSKTIKKLPIIEDVKLDDNDDEILKPDIPKINKYSFKNILQTLILICGGVCIVYGLYTLKIETQPEKKVETPKLELKDVKSLYGYLLEIWPDVPFYENERITLTSLDENRIFSELIVSEGLNKKTYETEFCTDYMSPCKIGEIDETSALNKLKLKYGNVKLTQDEYKYGLITCSKEESKYNCFVTLGGYENQIVNIRSMINYIETDEKLDIYDKYLKYNDNKCYIDNQMTVECNNQSEFKNDLNDMTEEQLLDKYGQEYVHTYLKDIDGNFYWYSSQMKIDSK